MGEREEPQTPPDREEVARIPLIAEEARIGKRRVVTGTVRVERASGEVEHELEVELLSERARVERVPIGRFVDAVPEARREGDTWIVPVVEEVLVKRLRLVEELRVTLERESRPTRAHVRLHHDEVRVARLEAQDAARPQAGGDPAARADRPENRGLQEKVDG